MIQKNEESYEQRRTRTRRPGKHLQFEPLEKEGRLSMVTFDCVFLTQENADTTWEYEDEPNPEVFQEVKILSCVEVAVRITDDIPLLNWISHFAMKI